MNKYDALKNWQAEPYSVELLPTYSDLEELLSLQSTYSINYFLELLTIALRDHFVKPAPAPSTLPKCERCGNNLNVSDFKFGAVSGSGLFNYLPSNCVSWSARLCNQCLMSLRQWLDVSMPHID